MIVLNSENSKKNIYIYIYINNTSKSIKKEQTEIIEIVCPPCTHKRGYAFFCRLIPQREIHDIHEIQKHEIIEFHIFRVPHIPRLANFTFRISGILRPTYPQVVPRKQESRKTFTPGDMSMVCSDSILTNRDVYIHNFKHTQQVDF